MTANKVSWGPLWTTLVGALVAAIMVVAAFFVFVQSGEAAPQATVDKQPPSASASPKIIDGNAVPDGKYPFMAYIVLFRNGKPSASCGGTLVDSNSVLTAAHCLANT